MKKIILNFLVAIMCLCTLLPTVAAKTAVEVDEVKSVAGDEGNAAVRELTDALIAAIEGSSLYSLKGAGELNAAPLRLQTTLTEAKEYNAKEDKARVTALIRRSMGKPPKGSNEVVSEEDRQQAVQELNEISANPLNYKLVADVRLVNTHAGSAVFSRNFVGDKGGESAAAARYNACRALAQNILSAMENESAQRSAAPQPAAAKETNRTEVPTVQPTSGAGFRAVIEDMAGNMLYFAPSKTAGLSPGTVFTVYRQGGDIIIGGKVVGKKEVPIGTAKLMEIYEEYAVCQVIDRQSDIKVGDILKK